MTDYCKEQQNNYTCSSYVFFYILNCRSRRVYFISMIELLMYLQIIDLKQCLACRNPALLWFDKAGILNKVMKLKLIEIM